MDRGARRGVRGVCGRCLFVGGACLAVVACLPRERVNVECRWAGDAGALAPPGARARRAHLIEDVRLAQELGIRHADAAVGRPPPSMADWERAERRCTTAMLAAAARRHARDGVTRAELGALVGARDWWFDLLAVFLPAGVLLALVGRRVTARVAAGPDAGDRRVAAATLAALTPVVAGLALGLTSIWAGVAETLRYRNDHISYRAFQLPTSRHKWLVGAAAAGVFGAAAVGALRRAARLPRSAPSRDRAPPVG